MSKWTFQELSECVISWERERFQLLNLYAKFLFIFWNSLPLEGSLCSSNLSDPDGTLIVLCVIDEEFNEISSFVQVGRGLSIKSLYYFKYLLQRQMRGQISGNYFKTGRIYLSSFFLPDLLHLYMGIISCTKHIKTVLDFLHDWCFPQMFLVTPPFIEHCSCFHKFLVPCTNRWFLPPFNIILTFFNF